MVLFSDRPWLWAILCMLQRTSRNDICFKGLWLHVFCFGGRTLRSKTVLTWPGSCLSMHSWDLLGSLGYVPAHACLVTC